MLSDIEIAQSAELKPIAEIANQLGISADELEFYGKYKAKLSDELADRVKDNPDGKLNTGRRGQNHHFCRPWSGNG